MSGEVEVALIVAVSATSGPLLLVWAQARILAKSKIEDYERQDEVAERAKEAAEALIQSQKDIVVATQDANGKLDVIHTLVNSNMTSEMKRALVATQGQLVLLERVIALNKAAGDKPTADNDATVKALEDQIAEMESALEERAKQQEIADAQAKA